MNRQRVYSFECVAFRIPHHAIPEILPAMSNDRLEEILRELHEELSRADELDEQQVEYLRAALADIRGKIDEETEAGGLVGRLRELEKQFEETHPTLTNTIGQLADMLAQMGI